MSAKMPTKRKRTITGDSREDSQSRSPTPTLQSKRKKRCLQYDPMQICQELYETIRNFKSDDGHLLCEAFIRAPKRRTAADYYEVVSTPIDLLKIQQKLKTDEYEEIDQLTQDIELMVSNAKAYYKKNAPEYKYACDIWELYQKTKEDLLTETFGDDSKEGSREPEKIPVKDSDDTEDVPDADTETEGKDDEDRKDDPEDFEQLFAAVVTATEGDRDISEAFHLVPPRELYRQYYAVIKEPIDLKTIAQKIQDNAYTTLGDMERDLFVMVKNAKTFNEPKSFIYKDACTLKKLIQTKKQELEYKKSGAVKSSERIRTRERGNIPRLSAVYAAMTYPETQSLETASLDTSSLMDYDDDSGGETTMSEDESPLWTLYNSIVNYTDATGARLIEPYMKLPNKRFYPDYYEEIEKPMSVYNIRKKLKKKYYNDMDDLVADFDLCFRNAKQYNADESKIHKDAVVLLKVVNEKRKELEKFGLRKLTKDAYDEDPSLKIKPRKSISVNVPDGEKKRTSSKKPVEDTPKKRMFSMFKTVFEHCDESGRPLRNIFMFLPSKKDYPDYYQVITEPIDLTMIESKIKNDKYLNEQQMISDFELMFNNARHYNEEGSQVYNDANTLEKILKAKWKGICQTAEARRALARGKLKAKAGSPLSTRLQELYDSIRDYQDSRGRVLITPFMKLPLKSDYPDYYEVIKRPVDMLHIQQKMQTSKYETVEDMVADFVQMFDNACKYNEPDSLIYKDALTLQRLCLEKKMELTEEGNNVPDVKACVLELMTNLFISVFNKQDEEGRCYSDSFAELPERDPDANPENLGEKPLTFDHIKRNLYKSRYRRMDKFQEDLFKVFERARRLSRTDSQLYEDAIELQMYFIKERDVLCRNGEHLLTPALSYTERLLLADLEAEKQEKLKQEQKENEEKKIPEGEEKPDYSSGEGSGDSIKYKDHTYSIGDFIYVEPREPDLEPHIMCIEKIHSDSSGDQMLYGNWFYRPNETFHLATRKFLEKEVFKSDFYTSIPPNQILGRCFVMYVKDYFKNRPEGFADKDVYVCEFRYISRHRCFKKIKIWQAPRNVEVNIIARDIPLVPIRVASVFADKDKEDFDDGETSILDKVREDVIVENQTDDGCTYYEQIKTETGCYKLDDCVYMRSDRDKPVIARIEKMWIDKTGNGFFFGPVFVGPSDIEHSPTRLFYKNEVFLTGLEETTPLISITGKCSVLHIKDYFSSRITEISEADVFILESKYQNSDKSIKRLGKGLKKHTVSPKVTDDEIYFFKKPIAPPKEPSPLLMKVSEESVADTDEIQDAVVSTASELLNTSMEETPLPVEKSQKKVSSDDSRQQTDSKKTKAKGRKVQISGYILYSGEIRKTIQQENPDCSFGEISRIVGLKWRNLTKEEKEKYEEKAKKIAEEQQAKQQEAEKAFNESLTRSQSPWSDYGQSMSPGPSGHMTPNQQGYQQGYFQSSSYNVHSQQPGQYPGMTPTPQQGMTPNGVPVPPFMARGSPGMSPHMQQQQPPGAPASQRPFMSPYHGGLPRQPGGAPGPYQGMPPPGQTPQSFGASSPPSGMAVHSVPQQMAPPPPPPRPPSPMFVSVPPRTQRLLHSEAYLKYIEGLNADSHYISDWDKNLAATQENTQTPDESRLPGQWLAQGAGYHGNVTNALWALRDLMLKDTLNITRTLPFEAL
ncbi:hypothetical protein ACJMK2_015582 [Sinanodonta woodiana]|uniref:Protein polybromo-1 n=1 Tax=Sinanodonta woodiana TaxID=1069815 RepID=A0ABD3UQU7_SINWO